MDHPYQDFLHRLLKPARYLGAEYGVIRTDFDQVETRFCLAFPDTYEIGMSHLGLKVLYEILGAQPEVACERIFAPWLDLEAELRARGLPLLTLESARPLSDFDWVGFSLQFELTATNVLTMLELGGIPVHAADRGPQDPLVIGGGPVATHPEPYAPFFDLFLLGEAEQALPALLAADAALRRRGAPRADRLATLAARRGLYAPGLARTRWVPEVDREVVDLAVNHPVSRLWAPDLTPLPDTGGGPVPSIESVFDRAAIEISRGCNQGCRFCQAGFLYRPLRERRVSQILERMEARARWAGYDEVSMTALSTADYSALPALLRGAAKRLSAQDVSLSISSLRAVGLDGALLDDLRTGRAGSLTFAPEAGSQLLRDRINKRISESGLLATARAVAARGWTHLKLYFMIGLPGETDADVAAIPELGERVRQAARQANPKRPPRVTCAVNNFVPKPHTPMQWCQMADGETLAARQALLSAHPLGRRLGLRLHHLPMSLLEAQLARGDRRLAAVIESAYRQGARFDGWQEHFDQEKWNRAYVEAGLDQATFLRALPLEGRLPWDHLDVGVTPAFLRKEYDRMASGRVGPACGVAANSDSQRELACLQCGLPCLETPPLRAVEAEPAQIPASLDRPHLDGEPAPQPAAQPRPHARAESRRLRLFFAKRPPASYLSHLDLVRHVPRILRRAGLHPAYTQGYNPRPRLQFTPPLPVGAEGRAEACDVWLEIPPAGPPDPVALLAALGRATVPGLTFLDARWLAPEESHVMSLCHGADYRFVPAVDPPRTDLAERIDAILAQPHFVVNRKRKRRGPKAVNLRSSLTHLAQQDVSAVATSPGGTITFSLISRPEGTLRPREVLQAVLGEADPAGRLERLGHFSVVEGEKKPLKPALGP